MAQKADKSEKLALSDWERNAKKKTTYHWKLMSMLPDYVTAEQIMHKQLNLL